MPVMKEVVKIIIGEKKCKKLDAISFSNHTMKRRIADMSNDVFQQVVHQVKESPLYSIQLDKSTDMAGLPQLSVFIHYINNATISEDFLFCKALKLHTKGEDIFQCLNNFFSKYSIPWDNCAGICTLKSVPDNQLTDVIIQSTEFILKHNYFNFGNQQFLLLKGTAMGRKMAPHYANIFMANLEENFLQNTRNKPLIYLRYIDDIFLLWTHGEEELLRFHKDFNSEDLDIHTTMSHSTEEVNFLVITIRLKK